MTYLSTYNSLTIFSTRLQCHRVLPSHIYLLQRDVWIRTQTVATAKRYTTKPSSSFQRQLLDILHFSTFTALSSVLPMYFNMQHFSTASFRHTSAPLQCFRRHCRCVLPLYSSYSSMRLLHPLYRIFRIKTFVFQ